MKKFIVFTVLFVLYSCTARLNTAPKEPFNWAGANLYFLLTDRFSNGDPSNDINFGRTDSTAILRGFEGGDLRGVLTKLEQGYFKDLGVNAIWMTPVVEQVHGSVDEGTGKTYGFHGYWTRDWTELDPNFGNEKQLRALVQEARKQGIQILLDAVINHTGPITTKDVAYPTNWVRTHPVCTYENFLTTTKCTLVSNLPDILTESEQDVALPKHLVEKWKKQGRYEQEISELNAFFSKTGFPRAPKYYIMKWLTDYIRDYGISGYRVDTVKHTDEKVWAEFQKVAQEAFEEYKRNNPGEIPEAQKFFTIGEVYGYGISQKSNYSFGDYSVDYFANGFDSLINFDFKADANLPYEELFSKYSNLLHEQMPGKLVMNYATSHDDGSPFDKSRSRTYEAATKLLLTPGISQIYYGDETARNLIIPGAEGDATLRSMMNWDELKSSKDIQLLHLYYQKLGQFRSKHPAVGAGRHEMLSIKPYFFSRIYNADKVVIGLDLPEGMKEVPVEGVFEEGIEVKDFYSGLRARVKGGSVNLNTSYNIILLEENEK